MKIRTTLFLAFASALFFGALGHAQTTIENFSNTIKPNGYTEFYGTWSSTGLTDTGSTTSSAGFTQGVGVFVIDGAGATNNDTSKMQTYFETPLNLTGLSYVVLTAQALSTNSALSIRVFFVDAAFQVASAAFNASAFPTGSFTTAAELLTPVGGFNAANVVAFYITGNVPSGSSRFNFSFDNLAVAASAIPEPSTYAAIIGALALGFVAYRRRQRAA